LDAERDITHPGRSKKPKLTEKAGEEDEEELGKNWGDGGGGIGSGEGKGKTKRTCTNFLPGLVLRSLLVG